MHGYPSHAGAGKSNNRIFGQEQWAQDFQNPPKSQKSQKRKVVSGMSECVIVRGAATPQEPMTFAVFGPWPQRGQRPMLSHVQKFLLLLLPLRTPLTTPKSQSQGPNPILEGFGPRDWNLGLQARIWASMLGFEPWGWHLGLQARIWASS